MSSRLLLPCAAACVSAALASCGGGVNPSSEAESPIPNAVSDVVRPASSGTAPPPADLLAWNHGRVTDWMWFDNPRLRPADYEGETGFREFEPASGGDFTPSEDSAGRSSSTARSLITRYGVLRSGYASWGGRNGIRLLVNTESDTDYVGDIRTRWGSFTHFDLTDGLIRNLMGHGQRSAFVQNSMFLCSDGECSSSSFRTAIFGKRSYVPGGGDTGHLWLRRNGAAATWRGAMGASTLASGVAVAGEATVTYSVSDDSIGVYLADIARRDDGAGVIDATYAGPDSFAWTLTGDDDSHSDYWSYDPDGRHEVEVRFYGDNAQEAAGVFETTFDDAAIEGGKNKLVGGFVAKR